MAIRHLRDRHIRDPDASSDIGGRHPRSEYFLVDFRRSHCYAPVTRRENYFQDWSGF